MNTPTYSAIKSYPYFLHGSFNSQAHNLRQTSDLPSKKVACYTAAVSFFIKKAGARCFCSFSTLLDKYNELTPAYGLKKIAKSSFATIQIAALNTGIVKKVNSIYCNHTGKNYRNLEINIDYLKNAFPAVLKLANVRAQQLLNRKSERPRSDVYTPLKTTVYKHLTATKSKKNWNIITKQSKDSKYNNKHITDATFYKNKFSNDADTVYQLQTAARNGSINVSGAKLLLKLHAKHNIHCGISKFLSFIILSGGSHMTNHSYEPNFESVTEPVLDKKPVIHYQDSNGRWHIK